MKPTQTKKDAPPARSDMSEHASLTTSSPRSGFDVVHNDFRHDTPKDGGDSFLQINKILSQQTHEITRSILGPAISSTLTEKLKQSMQAGSYIPGIDTTSNIRPRTSPVSSDVQQRFRETYHTVLDYAQQQHNHIASRQLAYVFTFYETYGHTLQHYITSTEKKQAGAIPQEARQAQQELRERQITLEQQLGFPNIPALLTQQFLSPERREQLSKEYDQIHDQTNIAQRFSSLIHFSENLRREWSVYQITGTAMDMQRFMYDDTVEQQITEHVEHVVQQSSWETLIQHIAASYNNERIDKDIRTYIRETIGVGADRTGARTFIDMVNNRATPLEMRIIAITGLRNMAQDTRQDDIIREETASSLSTLSKDTTQDSFIRHEAIRSLGTIGGTKAIADLGELLTDTQLPDISKTVGIELCNIISNRAQSSETRQSACRIILEKTEILPDIPEIMHTLHDIALKNPEQELRTAGKKKLETIAMDTKRSLTTRRMAGNTIAIACIEVVKNRKERPEIRYLALMNKLEQYGTVEHIGELEDILAEKNEQDEKHDIHAAIKRVIRTIATRTAIDQNKSRGARSYASEKLKTYADISSLEKLEAAKNQESEDSEIATHIQATIKDIALHIFTDKEAEENLRIDALQHLAKYADESDVEIMEDTLLTNGNQRDLTHQIQTNIHSIAFRTVKDRTKDPASRIFALKKLEQYGDTDAIQTLSEIVHDDKHPDIVSAAKSAILAISLEFYNKKNTAHLHANLLELIKKHGNHSTILYLEKVEMKRSIDVRDHVKKVIIDIAYRVAEDTEESLDVRRYALAKFSEYAEGEQPPVIETKQQTPAGDIRYAQRKRNIDRHLAVANDAKKGIPERMDMLASVGEYGDQSVIAHLEYLRFNYDEPDFIREAARESICDIALRLTAKGTESIETRVYALKKLAEQGDRIEQLHYLLKIATDSQEDHNIQFFAKKALNSIATTIFIDEDKHPALRLKAINILKEHGDMSSYHHLSNIAQGMDLKLARATISALESIAYRTLAQKNERIISFQRAVHVLLSTIQHNPEQKESTFRQIAQDSETGSNDSKIVLRDSLIKFIQDNRKPTLRRLNILEILSNYKHISVIKCFQTIYREKKPENDSEIMQWEADLPLRYKAKKAMLRLALDFVADKKNQLAERKEALQSLNDGTLSEIAGLEKLVRNPAEKPEIRQEGIAILCNTAIKTLKKSYNYTGEIRNAFKILNDFRGDESIVAGLRDFLYDESKDMNMRIEAYYVLRIRYGTSALLTESMHRAIDAVRARVEPAIIESSIKEAIDAMQARLESSLTEASIEETINVLRARIEASIIEKTATLIQTELDTQSDTH